MTRKQLLAIEIDKNQCKNSLKSCFIQFLARIETSLSTHKLRDLL